MPWDVIGVSTLLCAWSGLSIVRSRRERKRVLALNAWLKEQMAALRAAESDAARMHYADQLQASIHTAVRATRRYVRWNRRVDTPVSLLLNAALITLAVRHLLGA